MDILIFQRAYRFSVCALFLKRTYDRIYFHLIELRRVVGVFAKFSRETACEFISEIHGLIEMSRKLRPAFSIEYGLLVRGTRIGAVGYS